jgi:hypothetical protein
VDTQTICVAQNMISEMRNVPWFVNVAVVIDAVTSLKSLCAGSIEVFQLEIVASSEGEAKTLGVPSFSPEDVLSEASRACTHVRKVQQLIFGNHRLVLFKQQILLNALVEKKYCARE